MKLMVRRDFETEKSPVLFLKNGAKHYHGGRHFSFIEKEALKQAIDSESYVVHGVLNFDGEDLSCDTPYNFEIRYFPDGDVRIGCVVLTQRQFTSLKKWAGVKEIKRRGK